MVKRRGVGLGRDVRHFAPGCCHDALGEVAHGDRVGVVQRYAHLFKRLAHRSRAVAFIFGIASSAWQRDVAGPAVAWSVCALDEEDFGVAVLHPLLTEEGFEPLLYRLFFVVAMVSANTAAIDTSGRRRVGVSRLDANYEGDRCSFLDVGRVRYVRIRIAGEVEEKAVEMAE